MCACATELVSSMSACSMCGARCVFYQCVCVALNIALSTSLANSTVAVRQLLVDVTPQLLSVLFSLRVQGSNVLRVVHDVGKVHGAYAAATTATVKEAAVVQQSKRRGSTFETSNPMLAAASDAAEEFRL